MTCRDAFAIIVFVAYGHNIVKIVFVEINLLYYIYGRRYGVTTPQKADIFECSWRPERAAASPRSPLLGGAN